MSSLSDTEPCLLSKPEISFREAFERLKSGTTIVIPKGSPVSQNNVAKEAGKDPSALKKARFPELIREIQEWIAENNSGKGPGQRDLLKDARSENARLKEEVASLLAQRDLMISELLSAKEKIFEQWQKIQRLESQEQTNVIDLRAKGSRSDKPTDGN